VANICANILAAFGNLRTAIATQFGFDLSGSERGTNAGRFARHRKRGVQIQNGRRAVSGSTGAMDGALSGCKQELKPWTDTDEHGFGIPRKMQNDLAR
jgi:hypothetical protein